MLLFKFSIEIIDYLVYTSSHSYIVLALAEIPIVFFRQSTRTAETVYIFYMKNGQKHPEEILKNVQRSDSVNRAFMDFLASLGWPVNVWHHTGKYCILFTEASKKKE